MPRKGHLLYTRGHPPPRPLLLSNVMKITLKYWLFTAAGILVMVLSGCMPF